MLKEKIEIYEGQEPIVEDVIYVTPKGAVRYTENFLYNAVVKVDKVSQLKELETQIYDIKLPKLPVSFINQVYSFFYDVYQKHKSEVATLLWYNFDSKEWFLEVPEQEVTGSSADYERDKGFSDSLSYKGFYCVGSIHSHANMEAFHSSTDDHDEFNFDGLHITIGKLSKNPQFSQRFIAKGIIKQLPLHSILQTGEYIGDGDIDYEEYPEVWLTKVKKKVYNTFKGYSGYNSSYNKKTNYATGQLEYNSFEDVADAKANFRKRGYSKKDINNYLLNIKNDLLRCPHCDSVDTPIGDENCITCTAFLVCDPKDEKLVWGEYLPKEVIK